MLNGLEQRIDGCLTADRPRLRDRLRALRPNADPGDPAVLALVEAINASAEERSRRASSVPTIAYPDELPISQRRAEIAAAIREHQVVVVCGETGSGKTTQLPKICLELGRGVDGLIGHTQPRRIAARSVAARIAGELGSELGGLVGYKVRFTDRLSPRSMIKLMTDGILLAETQHDRQLLRYDTLIIDEAHERSLNIDFLLGYLHQLLPRRRDLKVIITSATIDPDRFSRHFGGAPVVEVSGRTYPVEMRWRPVAAEESDEDDPALQAALLDAVDELVAHDRDEDRPPGDILVFLSGEREIGEATKALRGRLDDRTEILPLYARLSTEEQDRIFRPHTGRRVVLATNLAETSLTVPGIRFVVDPGFARISRYSPRTRVQRLPIERVSQASAAQRAGRCGRVESGVCIRLYDEEDFESRPAYTDPEILRTSLASVILQMKSLRLGAIEQFPFIDPPSARAVAAGYETLHELGALDDDGQLTSIGRRLARLPIDPRLGRMLVAAREEECLADVLVIVAALAVQDPRVRPPDRAAAADLAHQRFRDPSSDFLGYLRLWDAWREQQEELGSSAMRRWCREHHLSWVRMREWQDVHRQLVTLIRREWGGPRGQREDRRTPRGEESGSPRPGSGTRSGQDPGRGSGQASGRASGGGASRRTRDGGSQPERRRTRGGRRRASRKRRGDSTGPSGSNDANGPAE